MSPSFRGLTWDHPGATARSRPRPQREPSERLIAWARQPLEGFESHPIADLAVALRPPRARPSAYRRGDRRELPAADRGLLRGRRDRGVGGRHHRPGAGSYRWDGRHYALPLDVATQVMARDPDRVPDAARHLGRRVCASRSTHPVALSLAGPHAILHVLLDLPVARRRARRRRSGQRRRRAEALRPHASSPRERAGGQRQRSTRSACWRRWPAGPSIALVPLVFGYVNYARRATRPAAPSPSRRRRASPPAAAAAACSAAPASASPPRAKPDAALLDHLRWLMSAEAQTGFIPGP